MADYQYGLNCIVAEIKSDQELDLKFALNRRQYIVAYNERKTLDSSRKFSELLSTSDALRASVWYVISGPPGLGCRSWYVTDIWKPSIMGMEKSRLPEPIFSVVCKITHVMGKDFFVCDMGRHFVKDVILLPRNLVCKAVGNSGPKVGDYLLVSTLVIWELLDGEKVSRMIPLWAHWDGSYCTLESTARLNVVERGPENSALLIPDQIPCMWGVVQNVAKKSLKVYVPCIDSSLTVPKHAVFQHDSDILEEDWLQLWLTPQNAKSAKDVRRFSEVSAWVCTNCCWFGRAKRRYESYLEQRLGKHYVRHAPASGPLVDAAPAATPKATPPASKTTVAAPDALPKVTASSDVGEGRVLLVKERSGALECGRSGCMHVFHLGLMTIYGVKMASLQGVKMTELVEPGSDLRYRMNPANHHLKAVWIGPEFVTFKHLNFLPQMNDWVTKRKLRKDVVQKMLKIIMDSFEAVTSKEAGVGAAGSQQPAARGEGDGGGGGGAGAAGAEGGGGVRGVGDGAGEGWSEDSEEESEDELAPILPTSGCLLINAGSRPGVAGSGKPFVDEQAEELSGRGEKPLSSQVLPLVEVGRVVEGDGSVDAEKAKKKKASLLMLVLVELTKFLVEKGKQGSLAEACEISADFVARLEKALEGIEHDDLVGPKPVMRSVGLQTD